MHLTVGQGCSERDVTDTRDQQIPQELQFIDFGDVRSEVISCQLYFW